MLLINKPEKPQMHPLTSKVLSKVMDFLPQIKQANSLLSTHSNMETLTTTEFIQLDLNLITELLEDEESDGKVADLIEEL